MFEGENQQWMILAVVLALGLVGVIAVQAVMIPKSAEAAGCRTSIAFNASQGRCFGH
jgi:hypothetical protein